MMGFNYGSILACYGPCVSHDLLRGLRRGLRHGLYMPGGGGMLTTDIEASRWSNIYIYMHCLNQIEYQISINFQRCCPGTLWQRWFKQRWPWADEILEGPGGLQGK